MTLLYDQLSTKEANFKSTRRDSYRKVFKIGEATINNVTRLTHQNDNWYYKTASDKDKIVLHFTAGLLHADIGELTREKKVSVAYVVARSGDVYELFDPQYWSYHLGRGAAGGNTKMSRSSIGIEISNYGPLTLNESEGILNTWSGKPYCTLDQTEAYIHIPDGFRGKYYFATFTTEQYKAIDSLLTNLCREHDILRKLPAIHDRVKKYSADPGEGIWSHQNFRSDKVDVGPAFDWSRISGR